MHGDPFPHVVHWNGLFYLEDGHHRVVAAAVRGESQIRARIYSVPEGRLHGTPNPRLDP